MISCRCPQSSVLPKTQTAVWLLNQQFSLLLRHSNSIDKSCWALLNHCSSFSSSPVAVAAAVATDAALVAFPLLYAVGEACGGRAEGV